MNARNNSSSPFSSSFGWLRSPSFTCQMHCGVTASHSRLPQQQPLRRQIMIQLSLISYPRILQSGLAFAVPYGARWCRDYTSPKE
ncbi:hypothetical protein TNIN_173071 [Trichonephila inaurata madagascariensis]|uniref:Uncharacterized protein n=1 Tax=Trichonephila inaurata madagascariensis TaxID=2747483 RepID=A0A8X6X4I3_9ARAC|nr:hypothetical protein TNIN_173071 [Trichonephila inaurata madagascariensis]